MCPKELVNIWVEAFNRAEVHALVKLYHKTAVKHQVEENVVEKHNVLRVMFEQGFAKTEMVYIVENLFEDGDWDKHSFLKPHGLTIPGIS